MTAARVAALWRHPIKSHGRERLDRTRLTAGGVPFDRRWAVTHAASNYDGADWVPCNNFVIGTKVPALAGLWARVDEAAGTVTLSHRDRGEITGDPDDPADAARMLDWLSPLHAGAGHPPAAIERAPEGRGMTDTPFASVLVCNAASHRAVAGRLGRTLEEERWRGNIWIEGLPPWEEFDLVGREITIGDAVLRIEERCQRCKHTTANPVSGRRDTDTLGLLAEGWGHTDFGVYAVVTRPGEIAVGDEVRP